MENRPQHLGSEHSLQWATAPRKLGQVCTPCGHARGQSLTPVFSCPAETRGPLRGAPGRGPAHAIHRESCVPSLAGGSLGLPGWVFPRAWLQGPAQAWVPRPPGQPVWHRDRCQHRLRRQARRYQLHHLPRQQQGPAAHLGEPPAAAAPLALCFSGRDYRSAASLGWASGCEV